MNIPVKIEVGCDVKVVLDMATYRDFDGVVERVKPNKTYDVLINGKSRLIHITGIMEFTFGGIWVTNPSFPGW